MTADDQGVAAGLLASSAQLGTAVGVAVTTPLVAAAVPGGYRLGFLAATAVAVAGAAVSLTMPRHTAVGTTGRVAAGR